MVNLRFLADHARGEAQVPVAFLSTHVKEPDQDDWGNLKHKLKYLKRNPGLSLTL